MPSWSGTAIDAFARGDLDALREFTAHVIPRGHALMQNIRRGRYALGIDTSAHRAGTGTRRTQSSGSWVLNGIGVSSLHPHRPPRPCANATVPAGRRHLLGSDNSSGYVLDVPGYGE